MSSSPGGAKVQKCRKCRKCKGVLRADAGRSGVRNAVPRSGELGLVDKMSGRRTSPGWPACPLTRAAYVVPTGCLGSPAQTVNLVGAPSVFRTAEETAANRLAVLTASSLKPPVGRGVSPLSPLTPGYGKFAAFCKATCIYRAFFFASSSSGCLQSGLRFTVIIAWTRVVQISGHCRGVSGVRIYRQAYVAGLYCSVQWIFSSFLVVVPVELWNCGAAGGRSSYVSLFLRTSGALTGTDIGSALQSVVCSLACLALGAGPLSDVLYRWRSPTGDVKATEGPFCSLGNAGE